jgi:hypothetical protein
MYELYHLFGGYEYEKAFNYARKFFDETFLNGTLDITLKRKDVLSKSHFAEYVRNQSDGEDDDDDVWISALEGALVTEVINPSPYILNNIFHVEPDGSRSALEVLNPYSSRRINERKISVIGEWNVTSVGSANFKAPQEIPIRISWKIQMEKAQMLLEKILTSEQLNNITLETRMRPNAGR